MKKIIQIFLFLIATTAFSQFSKTHYIPPVSHSLSQTPQEQFLYISTPSETPIAYKIKAIGGATTSGTVSRNAPVTFEIGTGNNTQILIDKNNVNQKMNNKGYIIEAEDMVYVAVRMTAGQNNSQAGNIVSKGRAALGREFRIGGFVNVFASVSDKDNFTFATILATENNTKISFQDIKFGVSLVNNASVGNNPSSIILNQGESFAIAVEGTTLANRDGLIGALIKSEKDIVVNCGSFIGSNGDNQYIDIGMDQIVSAEKTGTEYIFIRGKGPNATERPLIIANENGTEVFVNGISTITLNAGQYISIDGSKYSINGNMFVSTSKKTFAYQGIGGSQEQYNQNLHFVPPISCSAPKKIDNIPFINKIGNLSDFIATACIVTKVGASLNFVIDGINYNINTITNAPISAVVIGPKAVSGKDNYETYTITGLKGNVSVFSSKDVYLSYYGSSGFATCGGFYSGFTFDPEITFNNLSATQIGCFPFVELKVNTISAFDDFQWYKNGSKLVGKTDPFLQPDSSGYYYVEGTINDCGLDKIYKSVEIPVSICAADFDNDSVNDNLDLDIDGDGITNCVESSLKPIINLSNSNSGNISVSNFPIYDKSFNGQLTIFPLNATNSFIGKNDGSFVTSIPAGKSNFVSYTLNLNDSSANFPFVIEYIDNANDTDLLNSDSEFQIKVPTNKTISVQNLDNQLLIDTNYDGVFESGVEQFTSFDIRFVSNKSIPLPAGTGTFKFITVNSPSITFVHKNLSETNNNKSSFKITSDCIGQSIEGINRMRKQDLDSDDDGILDNIEAQGIILKPKTNIDLNKDGIDDVYTNGIIPADTDNDSIANFIDLDSDNDGVFDYFESGLNVSTITTNSFGSIISGQFGTNGLNNSVETFADSGFLNYTISDNDSDGIPNYLDLDSDGDECNDVTDSGFSDTNNDGYLGTNAPPIVSEIGIVTSGSGYTNPAINYLVPGLISISKQPTAVQECNLQNTIFSVETNVVNTYQWQVLINNGSQYSDLSDNLNYSGSNTNSLSIIQIPSNFNDNKYRVYLTKTGNTCGKFSNSVNLKVNLLPVLIPNLTLKQCDIDPDGISDFNLNAKNSFISANYLNENFSFYTSQDGADTKNIDFLIPNSINYTSTSKPIFVRVENKLTNCFSTTILNLVVSIPPPIFANYLPEISVCDDFLDINGSNNVNNDDEDGISGFNLTTIQTEIFSKIPNPTDYFVKFYKNLNDALSEIDANGNPLEIINFNDYRNINSINEQFIFARAENSSNNDCFGLIKIRLKVNSLPKIKPDENGVICRNKPNIINQLRAGINDGSPDSDYSYIWKKDNLVLENETNSVLNYSSSGVYNVQIKNRNSGCTRSRNINVIDSDVAILSEPIIVDIVEDNSITINLSGIGAYEFSLDDEFGVYQASNLFKNLSFGPHEIFVRDKNNCGTVSQKFNIIGAPQFFTPNQDGINEFWNVKGINAENFNSLVNIYDRFGKLIKQIKTNEEGWDGKFNSENLPSDDYWYFLELKDGRTAKGHFSLKR